ncbi:hypothetical protein [Desulfotomaculum sp. 1211_IL3151]|uniref:hypothetical protein n=1 Tax=Desulfotomaculum sp. 1211_IL3151 TaxID=3084055 RepID=UPI002FDA0D63
MLLWEAVTKNGLEGIMSKKKNRRYEHRRSANWIKITDDKEMVINILNPFSDLGISCKIYNILTRINRPI